MDVVKRLESAGLSLPPYQPLPVDAPRVRTLVVDPLVYVSGHGPDVAGADEIRGYVGAELDLERAREAARRTALNILATLQEEVGLDRVVRMVKVLGMVRSAPGFVDQPAVIDAASDVFMAAFGPDRGIHTRSAVGLAELPGGIPVEIEAQAQIRPHADSTL